MKADEATISVVAVTFNSSADIVGALQSAVEAARGIPGRIELIVVDNASHDGSARLVRETFPSAQLIQNDVNVGFGRAVNQAMDIAHGDRLLLLNPDARLAPDTLEILLSSLDRLRGGGAAPSIGERGAESAGMAPGIRAALGHFLYINRILPGEHGGPWRGVQLRRSPSLEPRRVDWASAAVLLLDARAVGDVSGFDESFFLYGEDVDLGIRLRDAGHQVWLVPAARASHAIAASQGGVSTGWVDALHHLCARGGGRFRPLAFDVVMAAGLTIRTMSEHVRSRGQRGGVHGRRMRAGALRAWRLVWLGLGG